KRTGDAGFPVGDVVVLAEESSAVTVLADNLRDHRTTPRHLPGVAGEAASELGDAAGGRGVMVSAGEDCRPRRRAEGGRVVAGVLEAVPGELVEVWRRNLPAEGAPLTEAAIVDQDEEDVGRTGRRFDNRYLRHLGILVSSPDDAGERGLRRRQDR